MMCAMCGTENLAEGEALWGMRAAAPYQKSYVRRRNGVNREMPPTRIELVHAV